MSLYTVQHCTALLLYHHTIKSVISFFWKEIQSFNFNIKCRQLGSICMQKNDFTSPIVFKCWDIKFIRVGIVWGLEWVWLLHQPKSSAELGIPDLKKQTFHTEQRQTFLPWDVRKVAQRKCNIFIWEVFIFHQISIHKNGNLVNWL